ncbi:hypothetical protein V1481_01365 [Aeromonas enteropelogenes]|uniref:hypothetical protein n=1 Tax=Aeromonas enteropelogenes TaxID=29489 RepID=UPI0031365FCD
MSSKINVFNIIGSHFISLFKGQSFIYICIDFFTFVGLPALLAFISALFKLEINNDVISLAVNFGAIFTALLLSVLVLVYEQESKLRDKISSYKERCKDTEPNLDYSYIDPNVNIKLKFMGQLYVNISYCIITSILLVACSAIALVFMNVSCLSVWNVIILNPTIVFLLSHILITILMVVKRIHSLLVIR